MPPRPSTAHDRLGSEARARACRDAVLAFYDVDPWSREHLGEWLVRYYAPAVVSRREGGIETVDCGPADEWPIRSLVLRSRLLVAEQVALITSGDDAAPIAHALVHEHVVAGSDGWVAIDHFRMELWERLLSLVAVDYLTNSEAFVEVIHACTACGSVLPGPCECGGRRQRSGIVTRPPEDR